MGYLDTISSVLWVFTLLYRLKIYSEVYMLFMEYTHIYEELPIKAYHIFLIPVTTVTILS